MTTNPSKAALFSSDQPLTPVMTADEPPDTSNREKRSREEDLMMKSCAGTPLTPQRRAFIKPARRWKRAR